MNTPRSLLLHRPFPLLEMLRLLLIPATGIGFAVSLTGQTGPQPAQAEEETIILSPFEVTASSDHGYVATETLAGSRLNTPLTDVATQVNVMTKEFMEDLAITTLDDAIRYSLNTETRFETVDVTNSNDLGTTGSISVIGSGQGGRTRGLSASNNSHDFFDTFIRMDTYNTERFTFASGPNSILFGNSGPAGTIDTTFKRAQAHRRFFEVSSRFTSTGSARASFDANVPIVKNKLAVRVAGLTDRDKGWRKPSFGNQDRIYGSMTWSPYKWLSVRAYVENGRFHYQEAKNTLIYDQVTPWILAGKPLFNNGADQGTLPNGTVLFNSSKGSLRLPQAAGRPIIIFDGNGFSGLPINSQNYLDPVTKVSSLTQPVMALTTGGTDAGAYIDGSNSAPDNFNRSIVDESLYPYDRNINGPASQSRFRSWIRGASVELNPVRNLFLEFAANEEKIVSRGVEFMNGNAQRLQADPNMYLNDRITPNPYVGRYYYENTIAGFLNNADKSLGTKKQMRVSLSYELNFEDHKGWTKWLGMHRIAGLWDHLQSTRVSERSDLTLSPRHLSTDPVGVPYSFVGTDSASQDIGIRYYIDPSKGDWTINLPFDVNRDGRFTMPGWVDPKGNQVYLATFDPTGNIYSASKARNEIESKAFVTQSYFFNRRLLLGYARRNDSVDIKGETAARSNWDFDALVRSIPWDTLKHDVATNAVKSAVVHPLSWLSLQYSETTSQQFRTEVAYGFDGSFPPLGRGTGKDYGFTVHWGNRFSLRLNKYENVGIGQVSSVASNATPTSSDGSANNLYVSVLALERTVQANAPDFDLANDRVAPPSTLVPGFEVFQKDIALYTAPKGSPAFTPNNNRYLRTSNNFGEGYELTLTANPTPNWRVALTGWHGEAYETDIAKNWFEFIEARLPVWGAAKNVALNSDDVAAGSAINIFPNTPANTGRASTTNLAGYTDNIVSSTAANPFSNNWRTYAQYLSAAVQNWYYIKKSEGRIPNNLRRYRLTLTSNYAFNQGWLKGFNFGGNYVWRSKAAVGYPVITVDDNPFVVPGVAERTFSVADIDHPYMGGALVSFDAFCGYGRKLSEGKIGWKIQLNIRNVLNKQDLLVQRTASTGVPMVFTPQDPRTFILTNTFSF